ncbi:hypothetical protein [Legionella rubrilucens]|uniref:hypothetical protein n=1 Tax=Legionella rubrilucens TaxID=458 RepID=UPI00072FD771|nr:hypothetical protein [Legionella rubrilucens]
MAECLTVAAFRFRLDARLRGQDSGWVVRLHAQGRGWIVLPAQAGIHERAPVLITAIARLVPSIPLPGFDWLSAFARKTADGLSAFTGKTADGLSAFTRKAEDGLSRPRRRASMKGALVLITAIACLVPSPPQPEFKRCH